MSTLENLKTHFLPELTPEADDLVEIYRGTVSGKATVGTLGSTLWNDTATFKAGALVIDRGGIWSANGVSTNSRPISGNANWTLVGGTPYVEYEITPPELTTVPFYDPNAEGDGYDVIPAPGANLTVLPLLQTASVSDGDAWGTDANILLQWGTPLEPQSVPMQSADLIPPFSQDLSNIGRAVFVSINADSTQYSLPPGSVNKKLTVYSGDDITNGGTFGTRSVTVRIYYTIVPSAASSAHVFYHVTDVNQGTKTFTVNGDAHTLSGSISVVGSTGNDGTYTIVTATFVTDHTDIIVVQAIPSATADGWVKQ